MCWKSDKQLRGYDMVEILDWVTSILLSPEYRQCPPFLSTIHLLIKASHSVSFIHMMGASLSMNALRSCVCCDVQKDNRLVRFCRIGFVKMTLIMMTIEPHNYRHYMAAGPLGKASHKPHSLRGAMNILYSFNREMVCRRFSKKWNNFETRYLELQSLVFVLDRNEFWRVFQKYWGEYN